MQLQYKPQSGHLSRKAICLEWSSIHVLFPLDRTYIYVAELVWKGKLSTVSIICGCFPEVAFLRFDRTCLVSCPSQTPYPCSNTRLVHQTVPAFRRNKYDGRFCDRSPNKNIATTKLVALFSSLSFVFCFTEIYVSNSTSHHKYVSFIIFSNISLKRFTKYCVLTSSNYSFKSTVQIPNLSKHTTSIQLFSSVFFFSYGLSNSKIISSMKKRSP